VTSGPSLRILATATQSPAAAATIGIIHNTESLVRLWGTPLDCATKGSVRPSLICELPARLPSQSQLTSKPAIAISRFAT
jgi:hypothetical protein